MTRSRSDGRDAGPGAGVLRDQPLAATTAELTRMLGDADPEVREATGVATLVIWIAKGVYDDHLTGLGDTIATGLRIEGTPEHRRIASARVLTACLERAQLQGLVSDLTVLRWADHVLTWFAAEPASAALEASTAALLQVARSARLGVCEQVVLVEVILDRILSAGALDLAGLDHLATATIALMHRLDLTLAHLEPLLLRVGRAAVTPQARDRQAESFLRVMHTHLSLTRTTFPLRADVLLLLVDLLHEINPVFGGRAPK